MNDFWEMVKAYLLAIDFGVGFVGICGLLNEMGDVQWPFLIALLVSAAGFAVAYKMGWIYESRD